MARSSLFEAQAAASRVGVLRGSQTWWVEGRGGCRNEDERALTVTRSQRAESRNGGLQGWTAWAQRACVRSRERAIWVRARCLRLSMSTDELAAPPPHRRVLATRGLRSSAQSCAQARALQTAGTRGGWAGPGALDKHTAAGRGQAGGEAKKTHEKEHKLELSSGRWQDGGGQI
jgi:hypothetical protein